MLFLFGLKVSFVCTFLNEWEDLAIAVFLLSFCVFAMVLSTFVAGGSILDVVAKFSFVCSAVAFVPGGMSDLCDVVGIGIVFSSVCCVGMGGSSRRSSPLSISESSISESVSVACTFAGVFCHLLFVLKFFVF